MHWPLFSRFNPSESAKCNAFAVILRIHVQWRCLPSRPRITEDSPFCCTCLFMVLQKRFRDIRLFGGNFLFTFIRCLFLTYALAISITLCASSREFRPSQTTSASRCLFSRCMQISWNIVYNPARLHCLPAPPSVHLRLHIRRTNRQDRLVGGACTFVAIYRSP